MENVNNQRELDDRISEVANKTLQREQLLEQRIKILERKLELKEVKDRLTNLENFKNLVLIVAVGISIYKMFV
jgi:hypothetical protein